MDHEQNEQRRKLQAAMDALAEKLMAGAETEVNMTSISQPKKRAWWRRLLHLSAPVAVKQEVHRTKLTGRKALLAGRLLPMLEDGRAAACAESAEPDDIVRISVLQEQAWGWARENRLALIMGALGIRPLDPDDLIRALSLVVEESFHREVASHLPAPHNPTET